MHESPSAAHVPPGGSAAFVAAHAGGFCVGQVGLAAGLLTLHVVPLHVATTSHSSAGSPPYSHSRPMVLHAEAPVGAVAGHDDESSPPLVEPLVPPLEPLVAPLEPLVPPLVAPLEPLDASVPPEGVDVVVPPHAWMATTTAATPAQPLVTRKNVFCT